MVSKTTGFIDRFQAAHDLFNAGNNAAIEAFAAPDFRLTDYGKGMTCTTPAEFRGWLDSHKEMSADMQIVDPVYVAAGDWVIARFRAVGHQTGPLGPFPATGKPFSMDVCEVWRFNEAGLAVEGYDYSNFANVATQLGHLQLG
ncbi:MAG: nuclear transport factor 2 family protein [Armatimonas sp.]